MYVPYAGYYCYIYVDNSNPVQAQSFPFLWIVLVAVLHQLDLVEGTKWNAHCEVVAFPGCLLCYCLNINMLSVNHMKRNTNSFEDTCIIVLVSSKNSTCIIIIHYIHVVLINLLKTMTCTCTMHIRTLMKLNIIIQSKTNIKKTEIIELWLLIFAWLTKQVSEAFEIMRDI